MRRLLFCILIFSYTSTVYAFEIPEMVEAVEEVNNLRETMVTGVPQKVTPDVFKAVCGPVGKKAKKIGKEKGWVFRQASHKNRNPKMAASKVEKKAIKQFKKDPSLQAFWMSINGKDHYFRKILVRTNCLACHGAKATRPEFIKKKYLNDKAYGFKEGDVRGIYHVFKK